MAWLQSGLFHSRSVHLTRIANKLPGRAKKLSRVRQLERLLANHHIRVRDWYHPVAAGLLCSAAAAGGPLRLMPQAAATPSLMAARSDMVISY